MAVTAAFPSHGELVVDIAAAAVIAADARAGLFGPVRLARPSACLGEISGGRINGGASPPFVRVKAEDSSLKNIRL